MANLLLLAAVILGICGMGWLALAMDSHWKQVRSGLPSPATVRLLRYLGGTSLFISLVFCLAVDHATMASLVWVMLLAVAALTIALVLAWQPRLLAPLVLWLPKTER
ncbi:DUF3325 domain-containing protein [Cellvibrio japonicus]|uniref:DUF3325 domain-containing protein n=1 Tax=Cellvibrio japonicus (strain Ueda107) TaxID=498211 RepID=B3PJU7_CELJU|nr:DUF3325 domain-containing protein [Cellvibrio japonicus]ACE84258.1 hypothetical protein CJA_2309 [Cellvibrio japonicus Ueda107]QEI12729.1 DUF3325 domain-containing protein [Cellvibrio japonicus]QEI16303.1 DUF3325 domain-containing protein [Cellvibrio japonicus]QEI19881.1 DUF3325 domain-containing protein [Cellvibrio japonicus]